MVTTLALWAASATPVAVWLVAAVPLLLQTPLISLSRHPRQRLASSGPREPSSRACAALPPCGLPVPACGAPGQDRPAGVPWGHVGQSAHFADRRTQKVQQHPLPKQGASAEAWCRLPVGCPAGGTVECLCWGHPPSPLCQQQALK